MVAGEVRSLAQRSALVARETAAVLANSQAATERSAAASRKVESDFREIVRDISRARSLLQQADGTAELQRQHVQQITANLEEIQVATAENARCAGRFA